MPRGSILPGAIRRQRCRCRQAASCPPLEWLILVTSAASERVTLFRGEMPASVAARVGSESLRHAMRSWSINSEEDLSDWFGRSGFPATRPGNHIPGRAQEHIMTVSCQVDARVAFLECVVVALTLDEGRQRPPNNTSRSHHGARTRDTGIPLEVLRSSWDVMDEVNLEEVFLSRTPMLRSCPAFLRGRFRPVSALLFGRDAEPNWLGTQWRKRGLGRCSVLSRQCCFTDPEIVEEWAKRSLLNGPTCLAEDIGEICWQACERCPHHPHHDEEQDIIREQKRRGRAACNRVQQGPVLSATGACGSHFGSENPRNSRGGAGEKATREGSGDSCRGDGEQPQTCELGQYHFLKVLVQCTFGQRSWIRRRRPTC